MRGLRPDRRTVQRVPVLAMVDTFVGGTAILLIFIILSNNLNDTPGTQPQTDVTLRCADRAIAFLPPAAVGLPDLPADPMPPAEAAEWLAAHPRPDRLLLRVRIEAETGELLCSLRFRRAATEMNEITDDALNRDTAEERAVLMVSLVPVDPAEAPQ